MKHELTQPLHEIVKKREKNMSLTTDAEIADEELFRPFLLAVRAGDAETVDSTLAKQPHFLFKKTLGECNTALMHAIDAGCYPMVAHLLTRPDVNPDELIDCGHDCITLSIRRKHTDITELLLTTSETGYKRGYFIHAARKNQIKTLEHFTDRQTDGHDYTEDYQQALAAAVQYRSVEAVQFLLDTMNDRAISADDFRQRGDHLVAIAASESDLACFELILNTLPGQLSLANTNGVTPLMLAASSRRKNVLQHILTYSFDDEIDLTETDKAGNTALHHVARHGCYENIQILLAEDFYRHHPAVVNCTNHAQQTPLALAASTRSVRSVEAILAVKSEHLSINYPDANQQTPLMHAVCEQNDDMVLALARDIRTEINTKNSNHNTPLMQLIIDKAYKAALHLLKTRIDVDIRHANENGDTALLLAIQRNAPEELVQAILIKRNIVINHKNKLGLSALRLAVQRQNEFCVKAILAKHNIHVDEKDTKTGDSLLHTAVHQGSIPILDALMDYTRFNMICREPIDPNPQNQAGDTPLMIAIRLGNDKAVAVICDHMQLRHDQHNKDGKTIFDLVADYTNQKIEALLITRFPETAEAAIAAAKTRRADRLRSQKTALLRDYPLHLAVATGDLKQVREVLGEWSLNTPHCKRISLKAVNRRGPDGRPPLHDAIRGGNLQIVHSILRAKANIMQLDNSGLSGMDLARRSPSPAIQAMLEAEYHATPDSRPPTLFLENPDRPTGMVKAAVRRATASPVLEIAAEMSLRHKYDGSPIVMGNRQEDDDSELIAPQPRRYTSGSGGGGSNG